MQIVKKVLVKQIITKKSKDALKRTFQNDITQLERECQQLLFEQRKVKNKLTTSKQNVSDRFKAEIEQKKEKIKLIEFKSDQLDLLKIGSEIVEREVEALVDLTVGSDWDELMNRHSIVIEDGIVVRFDKG